MSRYLIIYLWADILSGGKVLQLPLKYNENFEMYMFYTVGSCDTFPPKQVFMSGHLFVTFSVWTCKVYSQLIILIHCSMKKCLAWRHCSQVMSLNNHCKLLGRVLHWSCHHSGPEKEFKNMQWWLPCPQSLWGTGRMENYGKAREGKGKLHSIYIVLHERWSQSSCLSKRLQKIVQ